MYIALSKSGLVVGPIGMRLKDGIGGTQALVAPITLLGVPFWSSQKCQISSPTPINTQMGNSSCSVLRSVFLRLGSFSSVPAWSQECLAGEIFMVPVASLMVVGTSMHTPKKYVSLLV